MGLNFLTFVVMTVVDAHFEAKQQEEAQQNGQRRVSGLLEKPLSSNGRNNDSQARKVNEYALKKANGPKRTWREKQ